MQHDRSDDLGCIVQQYATDGDVQLVRHVGLLLERVREKDEARSSVQELHVQSLYSAGHKWRIA